MRAWPWKRRRSMPYVTELVHWQMKVRKTFLTAWPWVFFHMAVLRGLWVSLSGDTALGLEPCGPHHPTQSLSITACSFPVSSVVSTAVSQLFPLPTLPGQSHRCSRHAFRVKETIPKSTPIGGIWKTYQLNGWHLSWVLTVPIGSMYSSLSPTQSWNCVCDLSSLDASTICSDKKDYSQRVSCCLCTHHLELDQHVWIWSPKSRF